MLATPASDHLSDKPGVFPDGGDRGADLGVGAHFRHACATVVAGLALSAVAPGVAAASASDAWAVGQTGPGPGEGTGPSDRTLIEHWDGTAWTKVPSPTPGPAGGLTRVTVVSASDAWAVGTSIAGPALHGVILHWNGTTWKRGATPAHQPDGYLLGVTASSASNIWAVGQTNSGNCSSRCDTIIEHWNGCMWTVVPSPNPPSSYLNSLSGIAIVSRDNAWAVGTTDYSNTLILHWNGTSWS